MDDTKSYNQPRCMLEGWYDVPCGQSLHKHHIISRQKVRGNVQARIYIDSMPDIFLVWICDVHNCYKWADTGAARKYLFSLKVQEYGEDAVREAVNNIPWKIPHPKLSYDGIMSLEIGT
jgi:hypothetical protein